jgi:2-dehydropantoate 2-reductase
MRIAIFGAGGAGGFFGAKLVRAGHEVAFIARGAHLSAIRNGGLRLETPESDFVVRPAAASDDPDQIGPVEAVVVAVKTWQVAGAAESMRPLIGPDTVVLPLQNGVEAPFILAAALGSEHVLGGIAGTISWLAAPGHIRGMGRPNFIKFAELDNRPSPRTERLRLALEEAGVEAEVVADVQRAMWEKFLFVVPFGGVGAVTRAPIGVFRSLPETRRLLERAMEEIWAVGRARGVALSDSLVAETMAFADTLAPDSTTSMHRDIVQGRPSELEAWNGAVVRLGAEASVPTPVHAFIYHSLLPLEKRARGQLAFDD